MKYSKPHLTFAQQVDHLIDRGMTCDDASEAAALLSRVGYYRFSAYAYPFRQLLALEQRRETRVQFRADEFVESASFDVVAKLAAFDRDLRLLCLDGLEAVELSLRVHVAYTLGLRSTFGHLEPDLLDRAACDRASAEPATSVYESWLSRYQHLQDEAGSEDFVTHYVEKYEARLPIWVAIEVMDFGSLVRLFGLLQRRDKDAVARAMGIPDGKLFARMLKNLNYLRNVCAHHARLWNRNLTYQLPRFPVGLIPKLGHLSALPATARKKIYGSLALLSCLLSENHSHLSWTRRLVATMSTFPTHSRITEHTDMGFPDGWADEVIWRG